MECFSDKFGRSELGTSRYEIKITSLPMKDMQRFHSERRDTCLGVTLEIKDKNSCSKEDWRVLKWKH